tara:strand:+ start:608 stop:865 length:258 start_codon:yes stop_codon:yes gene_type:complete
MRMRNAPLKAFAGKEKLEKISGELKKASQMHASQANRIDKMAEQASPLKGKITPSCKAYAKKKYKVWPSAYASGFAVKSQKAGKC